MNTARGSENHIHDNIIEGLKTVSSARYEKISQLSTGTIPVPDALSGLTAHYQALGGPGVQNWDLVLTAPAHVWDRAVG